MIAGGNITPDNLEPNPKNPIIAVFFRNIGHSDQLGSGVRNLFKYTKFYSGQIPELIEGDIFRITVPLNDKYSFDYGIGSGTTEKTTDKLPIKLTPTEKKILEAVRVSPNITQSQLAMHIGITSDGIRYVIKNLKAKGILGRSGSRKNGNWIIKVNSLKLCIDG